MGKGTIPAKARRTAKVPPFYAAVNNMAGVRVVEAVAPPRPARRLHVGRVAVDQLAAVEVETGQETVGAAVVQLHRVLD